MVEAPYFDAEMANPMPNGRAQAPPMNPVASILADPMHPFFLHPSESPGVALVSVPLTESN